jgi:hypothetical protein
VARWCLDVGRQVGEDEIFEGDVVLLPGGFQGLRVRSDQERALPLPVGGVDDLLDAGDRRSAWPSWPIRILWVASNWSVSAKT